MSTEHEEIQFHIQGEHGATGEPPNPSRTTRTTVVCHECKRLKLRCDRRVPCGSCVKRKVEVRCLYHPNASDKVDITSVHNRVLDLEAKFAKFESEASRQELKRYPSDRASLAVSQRGSSLSIPRDDVSALYLDLLPNDGLELQPLDESLASHPHTPHDSDPSGSLHMDISSEVRPLFRIFSPDPSTSRVQTGVTPELVALLPPAPLREALLAELESTHIMHPSVNWPWLRSRIEALFEWAGVPEEHENRHPRPTLSFFAVVAAGFAIATVSHIEANRNSVPDSSTTDPHQTRQAGTSAGSSASTSTMSSTHLKIFDSSNPQHLYVLSKLAASTHKELYGYHSYDPDYAHVHLLWCLYLLHDGRPQVAYDLYPLVGEMVNVARMMGLNFDPDDCTGNGATAAKAQAAGMEKFTLFEKEMRRRLWWAIHDMDLYVSDCMGQPPSISDDQHTTRMPAEVNESLFNPASTSLPSRDEDSLYGNITFQIIFRRLSQRVKSVKKRSFRDPITDSDYSIEEAVEYHREISEWYSELPDKFKLPMDSASSVVALPPSSVDHSKSQPDGADEADLMSSAHPTAPSSSNVPHIDEWEVHSPYLIAQRAEIVILMNRVLLKLFVPFLKLNHPSKVPAAAVLHSINSVHAIVHASRVQLQVLRNIRPMTYLCYSFGCSIFDAAVVASHSAITQPEAIYSRAAREDARAALEMLHDPIVATGRGSVSGGIDYAPTQAVKIVEMLLAKAEPAPHGVAGTKRKRNAAAAAVAKPISMLDGAELPFVGPGIIAVAAANAFSTGGGCLPSGRTGSKLDDAEAPRRNRTTLRARASQHNPQTPTVSHHHSSDSHRSPSSEAGPSKIGRGGRDQAGGKIRKSRTKPIEQYPLMGIRARARRETDVPSDMTGRSRSSSTASTNQYHPPPIVLPPPVSQPQRPIPRNDTDLIHSSHPPATPHEAGQAISGATGLAVPFLSNSFSPTPGVFNASTLTVQQSHAHLYQYPPPQPSPLSANSNTQEYCPFSPSPHEDYNMLSGDVSLSGGLQPADLSSMQHPGISPHNLYFSSREGAHMEGHGAADTTHFHPTAVQGQGSEMNMSRQQGNLGTWDNWKPDPPG
ncbi:hypothetical protein BD410DRAFT_781925 [Rickenella mellea]|uniref:Zn(2)-C6 fungal-type domain-containing protein n=1 Tax=Rickenella mellea TaxID=50990 RepID=A0A4Y7QL63_9AGAM|nr:hypothetical protein BD410DRAFT_781925 [Rickenella mellea]